ncbi:hypothetical protein MMC29_005940 [Sticta canariensis]|nr:hypothetical protein [Sticta canariensis]
MAFPPFNPKSCATLHNRLIGYRFESALEDRPVLSRTYTEFFHPAFLSLAADIDIIDEPILEFFFLIQNYDVVAQSFSRLTPQVLKPDPNAFFRFRHRYPPGEMKGVILLYPGARDSDNEGLLFDTRTGLAHWVTAPNWPLKNDWVPLERVLQTWVNWWRFGEILPDKSVNAWVILLQTIHRHSPAWAMNPRRVRFGPPFLVRAFRPPFPYVAPGIQVLTDASLQDMLRANSKDLFGGEPGWSREDESEELPYNLFPCDRSVRLCRIFRRL